MPRESIAEESWVGSNFQDEDIICGEEAVTRYTLPQFHTLISASILEDTLTELRILVECNSTLRISKTLSDMGLLLARKFGISQPPITDELAGIDPHKLTCNEYKLNKLEADRTLVSDVVQATYTGLALKRSYIALVEQVNKIIDRGNYRLCLREDETKNKILFREVKKQLRQQRNHNKMVIYDTNAIIDVLKAKYEDASLNAEIRSRYAMNWERARTEQHLQQIKDNEDVPTETIEYYKARTDYEQRVHTDVELVTNIAINETLAKVESWMNKYDVDMEAIDLKIQIQKNDYQNMLDKRVGLEDTIDKHDKLMKQWITFKEEREKQRQYVKKMTTSAIIVQAWWRGLLVRRQLGPYKVAKKKKDQKKK